MAINKKDLSTRLIAGFFYVAITSVCTLVSWWTTVIVIAVTCGICGYEFLRMAQNAGHRPYIVIGTATCVLIPLASCLFAGTGYVWVGCLGVSFVAAILMLLRFFSHEEDTVVDVALTLFGYLYIGLMLSTFILIRGHIDGFHGGLLAWLVVISVWVNDGFAYLGGSAFGKHKLAPRISPKKSWEGLAFGVVGNILVFLLIPWLIPEVGFGFGWAAIAAVVVAVASIIGDLTESHIKRGFDTKDSGTLMPGHGGLLDRSDSLIFASVAAYIMIVAGPMLNSALGIFL